MLTIRFLYKVSIQLLALTFCVSAFAQSEDPGQWVDGLYMMGIYTKNLSVNSGILFSGHGALEGRDESAVMGSVGQVLG